MVESSQAHNEKSCATCRRAQEAEEMAFAFLLALMPVIALTLFGNMGLL